MPELEALPGMRVMATPEALDAAAWGGGVLALRLAADDVFAIGSREVDVADQHAIIAEESGFVGMWLSAAELDQRVRPHVEWALPEARPSLAQGLIAGVPAKLWLTNDRALLVCAAAYADELVERLG